MENNTLSTKNVVDLHKELEEAKRKGEDTLPIYEKYAKISEKNREEATAENCSGNPFCANATLAETQAGTDTVKQLSRLPVFSNLNNDELAQLARFVTAENEESAVAIYQALPDYVKVALYGKEAVETLGLGAAVGGKGLAALGVVGRNKQSYQPNQQSGQIENLNQKQESAIRKIDNSIKNGLKDHDITGTLKDMDGNPVPKPGSGYWDHLQEMQNTLRGLRRHAETLRNVNNPEAQAAYRRATDAINKIESAIKGHGI